MNKNRVTWAAFALVVLLVLVLLMHNPLPPPKARAQHIQNVNRVDTVSFVLTNLGVTNSDSFPVP